MTPIYGGNTTVSFRKGHIVSKWQLLRMLHSLGYVVGVKEGIFLHKSPNNVIFRCQYLRYWLANLQGKLTGYYWIMEKNIGIAKDYVNSDDNSFLVD